MANHITMYFPDGDPRKKAQALVDAVNRGSENAVRVVAEATKAKAVTNLTDAGKVDRGFVRASITTAYRRRSGVFSGIVYVGAGHGVWVEFGRRGSRRDPTKGNPAAAKAAWPPVSEIKAWVRRNFRKLAPAGRTKSGRARRPTEKDLDRVAYLIGRKIARYGIKPSPFLMPAYNKMIKEFPRVLREQILLARSVR